ncbi:hypothetical protein LSH36_211g02046 [Paralvinella palmiformis]|uniref:THO complex subunit 1 n=1 Tax=Paralvinella palmiformis TaxID=53620 RepID=A0AAD9N673_9ANNE|nr:hypothetical protein LSH36_211g02046 [Paralvinella palmiformis]
MEVEFQAARESFFGVIIECIKSISDKDKDELSVHKLEECFTDQAASSGEKKAALDQAFRDVVKHIIKDRELTSPSILFILLQDIFDCITLEKCEEMFTYLEGRVAMWQSETYYNAGKNYLLRMCNDLLRRLSRSKNTVFCGRIQLFLASLFPLSEKSGLNLMSQFNLDNITLFNTKPEDYERIRRQSIEDKDDSMEVEEGETDDQPSSIPIDYNLYRKIWSLQDYFRKPGQCYDKSAWKCFTSLLDLELSDTNFRRNMLIQMLITFQYLQAHVKFKSTSQVLSEDQTTWIKLITERVMTVLRETPPDGDKFADTVEHVLVREENWNNWKNDGCPSFIKDPQPSRATAGGSSSRKRSIGDDLKASGGKLIKMGNSELTRLWNINPDNMESCRNKQKNFLPSLEDFFKDAIEQMDPEAMIEDEYKLVKNPTFAWKSLRLLSRKSPHFFAQTPNRQKKKTISEYLEGMLDKLAKEMPSVSIKVTCYGQQ